MRLISRFGKTGNVSEATICTGPGAVRSCPPMVSVKGKGGRKPDPFSVRGLRAARKAAKGKAKGNGHAVGSNAKANGHAGNGYVAPRNNHAVALAPMPPGLSPTAAQIWRETAIRYAGGDPQLMIGYVHAIEAERRLAGSMDARGYRQWHQASQMSQRLAEALLRSVPKMPAQPEPDEDIMAAVLRGFEEQDAASHLLKTPGWGATADITDERAREVWAAMSEPDRKWWLKQASRHHGKKVEAPKVS